MPRFIGAASELFFDASLSPDRSSDGPNVGHGVDCFIRRIVKRQPSGNMMDRVPTCDYFQILNRRILNSRNTALHTTNPNRHIQSPYRPLHDRPETSQLVAQGIFPKLFPCTRPKRLADGRIIYPHPRHDRRGQYVRSCNNFSITARKECNGFIYCDLTIVNPVSYAPDRIERPRLEVRPSFGVFLEHLRLPSSTHGRSANSTQSSRR
jgi:hypothetical protein